MIAWRASRLGFFADGFGRRAAFRSFALVSAPRFALAMTASLTLHALVLAATAKGLAPSGFAHARVEAGTEPLLARLVPSAPLQASVSPTEQSTAALTSLAQNDAPQVRAKPSRENPAKGSHYLPPKDGAPSDSGYYSARNVDTTATPAGTIEPQNPDLTGTINGYVVLRLQINARGTVDRVIVVRAVPDYAFGPQAFAAFQQARFNPARKAGLPVPSEMLIEMHYGTSLPESPGPEAKKTSGKSKKTAAKSMRPPAAPKAKNPDAKAGAAQ
jgi:TonB family protein